MATNKKGYYGKIVIFVMALLMIPMSLIMNAASIFYTPVTEELGISMAAYGLNLTIIMFCCAIGAPLLFTPLVRKVKMRTLLSICMIIEALCFVARALTSSIIVFYISSVVISLPMGLLCNVCMPIVANSWYPKSAGTAIGVMASTQGIGGMIFSALGGILIQNIGWRNTFWVWAAICIVCAPVAALLMRNDPSEVGQTAPGAEEASSSAATATIPEKGMSRENALKTSAFWILAILLVFSSFTANVNSYINPYCQSVGMSAVTAGFIAAAIQLGVFCNKIILGRISDKKGNLVAGVFYVITGIACFSLILIGGSNPIVVAIACFLLGPLYASVNLMGPLFTRELFGTKDQPRIWSIYVLIFCILGGSAATIWGLIQGKIGYSGCFRLVIVMLVILLVLIIINEKISVRKIRPKWDTEEESKS